jgi:hypothetical protein
MSNTQSVLSAAFSFFPSNRLSDVGVPRLSLAILFTRTVP